MTHKYLTVAIPFEPNKSSAVEAALDALGNPANKRMRDFLRNQGVHFVSMSVLPADSTHGPYWLLEASVDGDDAIELLAKNISAPLREVAEAAGLLGRAADADATASLDEIKSLMRRNEIRIGLGFFATPGLCFSGTPHMPLERIRDEYELGRKVRNLLEQGNIRGTPLQIIEGVRDELSKDELASKILVRHDSPLLGPAAKAEGIVLQIVWSLLRQIWILPLAVILIAILAGMLANYSSGAFWGLVAFSFTLLAEVVAIGLLAFYAYLSLRRLETSELPNDMAPDSARLADVMVRENKTEQNHLFGVSTMKDGFLRSLLLRLSFIVIATGAKWSKPGFLGSLGTIHFARWVRLPATNKLLFFSNYGGSWESYLEDFITKASFGLTGVWSNTAGYPRTKNLIEGGAADGDRFKRWARRQQYPTRFWYSAYPHLTTERIRINSALRQGLVSVSTEDEAAAWLACVGSRQRSAEFIESDDVQSILFGGMKYLNHAACLAIRMPETPSGAQEWLSRVEPTVSFGDAPPVATARILALSHNGLVALGCEERVLSEFPAVFREGMASPTRQIVLRDTGEDHPRHWKWGNDKHCVDAAIILYADSEESLDELVQAQTTELEGLGGQVVHRVSLTSYDPYQPIREPFGFVDGISQPIMKGTRRWLRESDAIHVVAPGEFILGYPDNRGYLPPSPKVPATLDPDNVLPAFRSQPFGDLPDFSSSVANAQRDLGKNGSFMVIRQMEQHVESFNQCLQDTADRLIGRPGVPQGLSNAQIAEWLGAKVIGRWKDGTSIVRYPHAPGTGWHGNRQREPDNAFLLGAEDPLGHKCPFGAHIRRTNPRDSLEPGSKIQLDITNRHRILRVGRRYDQRGDDGTIGAQGLLFMCLNADIERQFEFIQQTWASARLFHGLDGEVDTILGRGGKGGRLTIPTAKGPLLVAEFKDFATICGGDYFFLPGRRAMRFLCGEKTAPLPQEESWSYQPVEPPAEKVIATRGEELPDFKGAAIAQNKIRPRWDEIH